MPHRAVAEALLRAHRPVFVTGAGLSAASGLPVYRGTGGMYTDGAGGAPGVSVEAALSGEMLAANPCETWTHLAHIGRRAALAAPNDGHRAITKIQQVLRQRGPPVDAQPIDGLVQRPLEWTSERALVVTQNVDGFHATAGAADVVEIHGNAARFYCSECGRRAVPSSESGVEGAIEAKATNGNQRWHLYDGDFSDPGAIPRCGACDGVVRPDVILFGEMLPLAPLRRLQSIRADVCVLVGTTAQFPYIVEPFYDASHRGGVTVNINPGPPDDELRPWTDHHLQEPADAALTSVLRELEALVDG